MCDKKLENGNILQQIRIEDKISACISAYKGKAFTKTAMDIVCEKPLSNKDFALVMKIVAEKTNEKSNKVSNYLFKKTVESECETDANCIGTMEALRYLIAETIRYDMLAILDGYSGTQRRELFELRTISDLLKTVVDLMNNSVCSISLYYCTSPEQRKIIDKLLKIVEEVIERYAELWSRWKGEVERANDSLSVEEILAKLSLNGYLSFDEIVKLILPEIVAAYFLQYGNTCFLRNLNIEAVGGQCRPEFDRYEYLCIWNALYEDGIFEKYAPLRYNLEELYEEIFKSVYDVNNY